MQSYNSTSLEEYKYNIKIILNICFSTKSICYYNFKRYLYKSKNNQNFSKTTKELKAIQGNLVY